MILFKGKSVNGDREATGSLLITEGDSAFITQKGYYWSKDGNQLRCNGAIEVQPESVQQIGFATDGLVEKLVGALENSRLISGASYKLPVTEESLLKNMTSINDVCIKALTLAKERGK